MGLVQRLFGRKQRRKGGIHDPRRDCILLTRRFAKFQVDVDGFDEIYSCVKCGDYFVLAWHRRDSEFVATCESVELESTPKTVFCPRCLTNWAIYGEIEHPGARTPGIAVKNLWRLTLPIEDSDKTRKTDKRRSMMIERVVLLFAGRFPVEFDVQRFADVVVHRALKRQGNCQTRAKLPVNVLEMDEVCSESTWVHAVLGAHVYHGGAPIPKMFLTTEIRRLARPQGELVICFVPAFH